MRRMVGIILSLALACGLLLDAGCVRSPSNQPTTITICTSTVARQILRSTISSMFSTTRLASKRAFRVEVAMVSDNKNIHNGIIAAAAGEPGRRSCPICSFPIRRPFLLCLIRASLSIIAITSPKTSLQLRASFSGRWRSRRPSCVFARCQVNRVALRQQNRFSTAFPLQQA